MKGQESIDFERLLNGGLRSTDAMAEQNPEVSGVPAPRRLGHDESGESRTVHGWSQSQEGKGSETTTAASVGKTLKVGTLRMAAA